MAYLKLGVFDYYNAENFDKVLVSNEIEKDIWVKYAGFLKNNIIVAGLPRWDLLSNLPAHKEKSIFIFFTWRTTFTEKNYENSEYYKNLLSLFDNKNLKTLLKQNNIKIYYGIHHGLLANNMKNFIIDNKNIEIVNIENISHYVRNCDLLITDLSSISFDFLFQNKPVIYYLLDKNDKFLNDIDFQNNKQAFYQLNDIFNMVLSENEVINLVKYYINNGFALEEEKKNIANKFFCCKSNIRDKIYNYMIMNW